MNAPAPTRKPIPFGKYLLLDRINIGGMAEVWRGKVFAAGGAEKLVAIKRILPNIAEDDEFIAMFIDEAKITVQLTHANVAQIYELGHQQNTYFIAMEYIPGKDLRALFDRCRKKGEPAPVPLTCYVVAKLAEGLDYAHRKKDGQSRDMNIVHRDVSPQNMLISYEGEVKVIDFGIAKAVGKATKTQAGILKGKFGYMSPEQVRGVPVDRRSDVFALGVCLYEMLSGERLFVGDSDFSVLEKVRTAEVLPVSTYNKHVPEALERIVSKALAREVEDRYQYASEVADDLQRFLISSDAVFTRKELSQYMKTTFAEEVEREQQRLEEYGEVKPPEGMLLGDPPASTATTPGGAPAQATASAPPASPSQTPRPAGENALTLPPTLIPLVARRNEPAPPSDGAEPTKSLGPGDEADSTVLVHNKREYFKGSAPTLEGEPPTVTGQPVADFSEEATSDGREPAPIPPKSLETPPAELSATALRQPEPAARRQLVVTPASVTAASPAHTDLTTSPDAIAATVHEGADPASATRRLQQKLGRYWMYGLGGLGALLLANLIVMILLLRPAPEGFVRVNLPRELIGRNVRLSLDGVYLQDGKDFDLRRGAPLKRVRAGKTLLVVGADGYKELQLPIEVKSGVEPTVVDARPTRNARMARLVVLTQPADAELRVNGERVLGDPDGAFTADIPVGEEALIEVRKEGYEREERRVKATSTEDPVRSNVLLTPVEFPLVVTSNPPGATITAGGKNILGTTPANIRVRIGVTELTLTKRCFDPASVPVKLPDDPKESTPISGFLRKRPNCR